jgi:hypothetical protein
MRASPSKKEILKGREEGREREKRENKRKGKRKRREGGGKKERGKHI